ALSALPAGAATLTTTCAFTAQNGCDLVDNDTFVDLTMEVETAAPQVFGVTPPTASGTVNAIVNATTNGLFVLQGTATASNADVAFSNAGTATIEAVANATGAGAQNANAGIAAFAAINVDVNAIGATGAAAAVFANSGVLNVAATANATVTTAGAGNANADAGMGLGALIIADGIESAAVDVDNTGSMGFEANANAV